MKKLTTQEFIDRARTVHGDKYGYAFSVYQSAHEKVTIHCPEHGMFEQSPNSHLNGRGCPDCGVESRSEPRRFTCEEFIEKAKLIHGNSTYDYSLVDYDGIFTKVSIICPDHGLFQQTPDNHINAQSGCAECSGKKKHTNESFIEKAMEIHGENKYGYSKIEYVNTHEKVIVTCPSHGDFEQKAGHHLNGQGCPKCVGNQSKPETEIVELITSLGLKVVHGDRSVIKPLEIDILVPEAKLAIEFNGNYWHSDQQKPKSYHFDKTKAANEAGYRMIHVWEGDWDARKDQIKRIIINACGKTNEKPLNARDCKVEEIEMKVVNEFLDEHHIQGRVHQGKIKLGMVHKTEGLVAVMTFGKGTNIRGNARLNAEAASDVPWNLTRYAAKHSVRGGASKLFKAAVTRYELTFVESYSMNDYFTGGMYEQLGFDRTTAYGADYRVFHPKTGIRFKYHWQRRNIPNVLRDIGREDIVFNPDKSIDPRTEYEIEDLAGALRLWDSGKTKWTWRATLPEHI